MRSILEAYIRFTMFGHAIIFMAFVLGFALARASTCSVAATKRLVTEGKADWLFGLLTAISWSGVTLLILYTLSPKAPASPGNFVVSWHLFVGAAAMGVGAVFNQACFIGSVGKISIGNLSYLLTFAGLAVAQKVSTFPEVSQILRITPLNEASLHSGLSFWVLTAIFLIVTAISLRRLTREREEAIVALCVIGIVAALIYASEPNWSYQRMLGHFVNDGMFSVGLLVEMTVAALFIGAIVSSILRDRFKLHFTTWKPSMMNFAGGFLMGLGAKAVPGGNDSLVLWIIPSFALHGVVAYVVMLGVVALTIIMMGRLGVKM